MPENIENIRHSLSHLMSMAIMEKYPKASLGMGPAIENGFYQDYAFPKGKTISEKDFERIEKRMRGIAIREELTDEWQKRGAQEKRDYEILTAEISKATFGLIPKEYKKLKGLRRENLRDHMNDFELIFTMLGERATTEIHRVEDSRGVPKLKSDAKAGGNIAGGARKKLEKRLRRTVITRNNYLKNPEGRKLVK